jgi:hypothetical protein
MIPTTKLLSWSYVSFIGGLGKFLEFTGLPKMGFIQLSLEVS